MRGNKDETSKTEFSVTKRGRQWRTIEFELLKCNRDQPDQSGKEDIAKDGIRNSEWHFPLRNILYSVIRNGFRINNFYLVVLLWFQNACM